MFDNYTLLRVEHAPQSEDHSLDMDKELFYFVRIKYPDGKIHSGHIDKAHVDSILSEMPRAEDCVVVEELDYVNKLPGNCLINAIVWKCCHQVI